MPIKPPPTTATCQNCNWQKTYHPQSDIAIPSMMPPDKCPECNGAVTRKEEQSLESTLSGLLGGLFKHKK
jgi:NAD-dependent SIR2 family protein deacetylase